jgi:hypothetical protein
MAKYLILIYGDERQWAAESPGERQRKTEGHAAFVARAGSAVLGGHELHPSGTATILRPDSDGRPTPTDGPFPETKEVLGGYYLLEAPDLGRAVELAGGLPEASVAHCAVEIRRVREAG